MALIRTQTTKNPSASQTADNLMMPRAAAGAGRVFITVFCFFRYAHPWLHLAALFAVHIVGAFLIEGFMNVRHPGRLAALSALVAGFAVSLWAWRRYAGALSPPWIRLVPALCYAFFITAMSHQPLRGVRLPVSGDAFHPVIYACLAVFWGWFRLAVLRGRHIVPFALWVIAPGVLFAITDEWHQSWIPGRCSSASDIFLDLVGLILGTGVTVFLHRWAPQWTAAAPATLAQEPNTVRVTANSP